MYRQAVVTWTTLRDEGLGINKCGSGPAHSESSFGKVVVDVTAGPLARDGERSDQVATSNGATQSHRARLLIPAVAYA